jgi:uncharacterized integral membrane protein
MDNLNELKAIWQTAGSGNLPGAGEIKRSVKTFQAQRVRKKWFVIIASLLLSLLMVAATMSSNPKMFTTWVGGGLITFACMVLAVNNWRSLKRFNQLDDCSNHEFLSFIEQTGHNQRNYYQKTQVEVMMICSIGLSLYLYEPATHQPAWTAGLYGVTMGYLLIMWFVVRPKMFAKNTEKLNRQRNHFEKLIKQLETDEK